MSIVIGVLEEGLIYAVMALGVYITYKILDFPDLSVDSTYPLGAAVTAALIMKGVHPVATLFISFLAGAVAGSITGFIHVKLGVRDLLSGIIVMTGLYSINLRIAGKANLPIFSKENIFENGFWEGVVPEAVMPYLEVILLFAIVLICKILLDLYLNTRSGYLLRATGDNDVLVTSLAKDKGMVRILGLAIANGFVALAGSIYCQHNGFFEITTGTGTIVICLASVIIGTKMLKRFTVVKATTAVIIGSIVYKACVSFAISLGMTVSEGMKASDLKLVTSVLFLAILVASSNKGKKVKAHA